MNRLFGYFRISAFATMISVALAFAITAIFAPFRYVLARLPMPRLPTLASVADLIAPARTGFIADRFESRYMNRAAARGC